MEPDKKMFSTRYKIVASDMDITYHITPNAILLYFQDCFANFLSGRRLAAFDIADRGLVWMITEFDVSFCGRRPLWSDDIRTEIKIGGMTSSRVYVDYSFFDSTDSVFATGSSTWVIMDISSRRPFPADRLLTSGNDIHENTGRKKSLIPSSNGKEYYNTFEHQVNISDLDFNGHVCNRSYLNLATSTAPVDFIKTHEPKYVHIRFQKEAFFGETLRCEVFRESGSPVFWHNILNPEGVEICKVYSEWEPHRHTVNDVKENVRRPEII